MLIKPAAIEDAEDDDNCPKTGMWFALQSFMVTKSVGAHCLAGGH